MLASAMKGATSSHPAKAFTLVELLVVIVILAIFSAMLLPAGGGKERARTVICQLNLKQTALGFSMWSTDHNNRFPWQVTVKGGGTAELVPNGKASDHFLVLSNYLTQPRVLICPSDKSRHVTDGYKNFSNQNLSYFVRLGEPTNSPTLSVLAGDRHLQTDGQPVKAGLLVVSNNNVGWTRELHPGGKLPRGNVLFGDGHTELVQGDLTPVFRRQGSATNRLVIP